jgi:protein required for attachment to host cells
MRNTWIVVTDSTRARIFSHDKKGQALLMVKEMRHPESRMHGSELEADRPGTSFQSKGPGKHAMSQQVSPKEHEAWKLSKELADALDHARMEDKFDQLVLVAAPRFLGNMRKTLSDQVNRLVTAELDKNIAHLPENEILAHLPESVMS